MCLYMGRAHQRRWKVEEGLGCKQRPTPTGMHDAIVNQISLCSYSNIVQPTHTSTHLSKPPTGMREAPVQNLSRRARSSRVARPRTAAQNQRICGESRLYPVMVRP